MVSCRKHSEGYVRERERERERGKQGGFWSKVVGEEEISLKPPISFFIFIYLFIFPFSLSM
jgi:hypothetical protein